MSMRFRPWLIWTLLAVVCWGVWAVLARLIGDSLSAVQQQTASTLGLLPVMAALGMSRRLTVTGKATPGTLWALAAGALTCGGNIAYYDLLNRGATVAAVVPLTAMYPLVTVVLAVVFLREPLNRIQQGGIVLSLVAIYLFNVPADGRWFSPWIGLALVPIGLWGVSALAQKLGTRHLSGELATLWFLAAFVPVGVLLAWRNPLPSGLPVRTWLLVLLLGFAFALGNYALLVAFARDGKASVISPLAGLYPVVSLPVALFLLGERPGPRESAGILIALAAVAALAQDSPPAGGPPTAGTPSSSVN